MHIAGLIIVLSALLCLSGVIASLVFALGMFVFFALSMAPETFFTAHDFGGFIYVWFVAALVSVPTALIVGVPAFFVLRRIGQFKWWTIATLGASGGFAISQSHIGLGFSAIVFAVVGVVTSLMAWLLVVRSNISIESGSPSAPAHLKR